MLFAEVASDLCNFAIVGHLDAKWNELSVREQHVLGKAPGLVVKRVEII